MARKKTVKSETTDLAQPQNRTEEFLAKIAGLVDTLPQGEFSRLERYLKYIAENGGGGGGGGVTSFNTRTGAVTPESGDYSEFYAPSGYGLGEYAKLLKSSDDLNNITDNGWYRWGYNNVPQHAPADTGIQPCWMFVAGVGHDQCTQIVFSPIVGNGSSYTEPGRLIRTIWNSSLMSAWEWENPPLIANTEYRTTERYNGKPVYVNRVSVGDVAANSTGEASLSITNLGNIIEIRGICYQSPPLTYYSAPNAALTLAYDATNAKVKATNNTGGQLSSVIVVLKYTKSTD